MILTKAPILSELNSGQADLNNLPSGYQKRPMTFGNLDRLKLNFNILVTARLIVLITQYLPTTSASSKLHHLTNYELLIYLTK